MKNFKKIVFTLYIFSNLSCAAFGQRTNVKSFSDCGVTGSVSVYDYKHRKWLYTDNADARRRTLPASTFKIINTCIALETGAVKDENEVIKWDGVTKTFFGTPIPAWNKDSDLKSAYENSTIWYYVKLAERIGRKNYKIWLKKCRYGNGDLSEKGTDFWNYGHFGVSPIEQLTFLKAFYEEKLPFSKRTYEIARRIMVTEPNKQTWLLDKTGWTKADGQDIGWYVGYYRIADNTYFFATRLQKDTALVNPDFALCRKTITLSILQNSGLKLN